MKKVFKGLSLFVFSFVLFAQSVFAYGFDVSVTSSTVTVGNSVTLSIKVSDAAGKFSISSSNSSVVSVSASSIWIDDKTESITLKANKEGNATITITASDVTSYGGNNVGGSKTLNITVKPKQTTGSSGSGGSGGNTYTPQPKSSNNFLTSLTVDGLELSEKFDKELLEYSVSVPALTEKIKINAQLADSNASVTGTGEKEVSVGVNTFQIVVTAQNGSKRTYVLTANVLELEPIKVRINNEEYTVIRNKDDLPKISEYNTPVDITIDKDIVPGYHNEKLGYDLVALKDSKGKINYYIYKDKKYSLYKEYTFNGTTLQVLDKEVDKGFKKTEFTYDNDKITSYQEVKLDILKNTYALDNNDITGNQFYLFYAKNVETGKENLYQYDAVEKTIQRYNLEVLDMYKQRSDTYYMYLLGSILLIGLLILTFAIILIVGGKKKKEEVVVKPSKRGRKKKEIEEDDEE